MNFSFVCENPNCKYVNETRTIFMPYISPGLYDTPNPICECGMYPKPTTLK